jgi:hypothetical protein
MTTWPLSPHITDWQTYMCLIFQACKQGSFCLSGTSSSHAHKAPSVFSREMSWWVIQGILRWTLILGDRQMWSSHRHSSFSSIKSTKKLTAKTTELDTNCLIGRIQAVKLSAIDYWLWCSVTGKEWVMFVKYLQHIKWEIFIYESKKN